MSALQGNQAEPRLYAAIEKIEAVADGTIKVFGVASSERRDGDRELIKADAVRGAIPDYMQFPAIREMHGLSAAGKALEVGVDDGGVTRIVAHIVDPGAVAKVRAEVYKGFSIGGRALERDPLDRTIITKMTMHEISLVDRPCNPDAVFDLWKADGATYAEPVNPASGINNYDLEGQKSKPKPKEKPAVEKRDFSQKERAADAKSGAAMEGGSFPIENQEDLNNAVRLRGNGKHSKASVESHIRARAKALGLKVPEMDDTKKADGADLTMGEVLKLQETYGDLPISELVAKAATEAVSPAGSACAPGEPEHSSNDTSGRASPAATEAVSPEGSSHSVNPGAPAMQSTNQNFGAGVSRAATPAVNDGNTSTAGKASVPAHGAGAAGEGLNKADVLVAKMEDWLRAGAELLKATKETLGKRVSATNHKPMDTDMEDIEDSDCEKVEKLAGAARHPDDITKITSLEARIAELEAQPAADKSIGGMAKVITKAADTVSGYAVQTPDDAELLKMLNEMPAADRQKMIFKTILSAPRPVAPPQ